MSDGTQTGQRRLVLYLALVVLSPLITVALTLAWMSTGFYIEHVPFAYLPETGYGLRLHHADCQVVIYGDSTGLVGVVPKVIRQQTGLSTCDIADIGTVEHVAGLYVLDKFLENNPSPRYIVFLYSPEDLCDPATWENLPPMEALLFRLQHLHGSGVARSVLDDPVEFFRTVLFGLRMGVDGLVNHHITQQALHEREETMGRLAWQGDALNAATCSKFSVVRAPDPVWIASLRSRYGRAGTRVLIDVMPMADCDDTLGYYRKHLTPQETDNTLTTLPLESYTQTGHLHLNQTAAEAFSQQIAEQVRAAMKAQP